MTGQQPGHDDTQGQLWEELDVNSLWVHVLRSTPLDEMGINAIAVYVMLKTYSNLEDGTSFPGLDELARRLKTSRDTVERALGRLIDLKVITREKDPRHLRRNLYRFVEHVPLVRTRDKAPAGTAAINYVPLEMQAFIDELKNFAKTGNKPGPQIVINLTLQIGDNNTQNVQNITMDGSEASRDAIAAMRMKLTSVAKEKPS
jgi:predicted transcriptional regulator